MKHALKTTIINKGTTAINLFKTVNCYFKQTIDAYNWINTGG